MKKVAYYLLLVVLIGVFGFSAYKIGSYYWAKHQSDAVTEEAAQHVHVETEEDKQIIDVDFDELKAISDDIVGWIYCEGTQVNYPVLQGPDNELYLYHLLDGSWNINGSIFMDFRGSRDFSDPNNILYGHHMKSGTMFAMLTNYKEQSYFDEHPCMYLFTPQQNYRLDLFAGVLVSSDDEIYNSELSDEYLQYCMDNSTFVSPVGIPTENPIVTLSTCSFEFDEARYVVLTELVPLED